MTIQPITQKHIELATLHDAGRVAPTNRRRAESFKRASALYETGRAAKRSPANEPLFLNQPNPKRGIVTVNHDTIWELLAKMGNSFETQATTEANIVNMIEMVNRHLTAALHKLNALESQAASIQARIAKAEKNGEYAGWAMTGLGLVVSVIVGGMIGGPVGLVGAVVVGAAGVICSSNMKMDGLPITNYVLSKMHINFLGKESIYGHLADVIYTDILRSPAGKSGKGAEEWKGWIQLGVAVVAGIVLAIAVTLVSLGITAIVALPALIAGLVTGGEEDVVDIVADAVEVGIEVAEEIAEEAAEIAIQASEELISEACEVGAEEIAQVVEEASEEIAEEAASTAADTAGEVTTEATAELSEQTIQAAEEVAENSLEEIEDLGDESSNPIKRIIKQLEKAATKANQVKNFGKAGLKKSEPFLRGVLTGLNTTNSMADSMKTKGPDGKETDPLEKILIGAGCSAQAAGYISMAINAVVSVATMAGGGVLGVAGSGSSFQILMKGLQFLGMIEPLGNGIVMGVQAYVNGSMWRLNEELAPAQRNIGQQQGDVAMLDKERKVATDTLKLLPTGYGLQMDAFKSILQGANQLAQEMSAV